MEDRAHLSEDALAVSSLEPCFLAVPPSGYFQLSEKGRACSTILTKRETEHREVGLQSAELRKRQSDVVGTISEGSGVWPQAFTFKSGIWHRLPLSGWGKAGSPD